MKLYAVRIFVNDWDGVCRFYEQQLGLTLQYKDANAGWAEFDVGGTRLGVERVADDDAEGQALVGRFLGISLQVDDIEATYERLQANGVVFMEPPSKQAWGGRLAHLRDPEGNVITLLG